MSETTNLKLKKHDNPTTNTNTFDIENYLNENWDKIDERDEEVRQSIETLQNETIQLKTENERLKEDRDSMPKATLEDENINIEDSAECRFKSLEIMGNSSQDTREGYNLMNASLPYTTSASGDTIKWQGKSKVPKLEINKKYFLHGKCSDGTVLTSAYSALVITDENGQILNKPFNASFTNTVDISNASDCYIYTKSALANKNITEIAIYEGTEEKLYEPYGASPSPEYPSGIESCGDNGNINIKICNKNIYDKESLFFNNINGNNISVSNRTDKSCILTASARGFTQFGTEQAGGSANYRIKVKPNTEYTFSIKAELLSGTAGLGLYIFYAKDINSNYYKAKSIDYSNKITFTTDSETKYIFFRIDIFNVSSYKVSNILLEKGTTATEYIPNQTQNYIIPTQQPFRAIGEYKDTFVKKEGKWYERHYIKELILDGTKSFLKGTTRKGFSYFELSINELLGNHSKTEYIKSTQLKEITGANLYEITTEDNYICTGAKKFRIAIKRNKYYRRIK